MQEQPKISRTGPFLVAIALLFIFAFGYRLGQRGDLDNLSIPFISSNLPFTSTLPSVEKRESLNQNDRAVNFDLFWEVWDLLERKYVDRAKLETQNLYFGAIKGLVASAADPYTFFLTPDENKSSKDSLGGRFEGIGAQLGTKDGKVVVVAPIKNSPAAKVGIRAGDIITAVDGEKTDGLVLGQVVSKIRGPGGTTVKLDILRGEKKITVSIVRAQIQVDSLEVEVEGAVTIVKVNQFGDSTNAEWLDVAGDIAQKYAQGKTKGLVLDLRDNPGGYLDSAVFIASEFLPRDKLVVKQEGIERALELTVEREGKLQTIPTIVLINEGSASAAEILAGALRDYGRAKLVGEKSFGKGSVQEVLDLTGGSGLHITIAKWILPKGDWVSGKGITPETIVENVETDANNTVDARGNDKQLDKAIELLGVK